MAVYLCSHLKLMHRSKHVVVSVVKLNANTLLSVSFTECCVDSHASTSDNIWNRMQIIKIPNTLIKTIYILNTKSLVSLTSQHSV
jgi:hypothetical protein